MSNGHLRHARVGLGRDVVTRQLTDGLVQAGDGSLGQCDPDECTDDALRHGADVVAVVGVEVLPVTLVDQHAVAHDEDAADAGVVLLDHPLDLGQLVGVEAVVRRVRGAPVDGGPVLPLDRRSVVRLRGRGIPATAAADSETPDEGEGGSAPRAARHGRRLGPIGRADEGPFGPRPQAVSTT